MRAQEGGDRKWFDDKTVMNDRLDSIFNSWPARRLLSEQNMLWLMDDYVARTKDFSIKLYDILNIEFVQSSRYKLWSVWRAILQPSFLTSFSVDCKIINL